MRVVHDPDGDRRTLATDVDIADSFVSQTVGLMGKSSVPDDYVLVFEFDKAARRFIHMLFVRTALDVVWLQDGEVVKVETLSPWFGIGLAKSDTILEFPAGSADSVEVGDTIGIEGESVGDSTADQDATDAATDDGESDE